jgi:hypothetical protein
MARQFKSLEVWIGEALSDPDKLDALGDVKPCTAIAALHVAGNGVGTKEVHAVPLPPGKTYNPRTIANKIKDKIEAFAQDLGNGSHQFLVHAFYGGEQQASATHPLRTIDGQLIAGDDWARVAEQPNEKGLLAQMMRHLEHKDEVIMQLFRGTVGQWSEERHKLQAEVNEAYQIVREVVMQRDNQQHAMAMEQQKYARETQERKALMGMVPAIANGLTGKEIFPKANADTAMLDAMCKNVSPDQVDGLVAMGIIPKEMHGAVVARIIEVQQREAQERAELARMPPANRDGAADVQGN